MGGLAGSGPSQGLDRTFYGGIVFRIRLTPAPPVRLSRGDFDGDRKSDVAVYRPSSGHWFLRNSATGFAVGSGNWLFQWGAPGDVPQPGDYDGDGLTDIAVYRPPTGQWGAADYVPLVADFDGDRRSDIGVYHPTLDVGLDRASLLTCERSMSAPHARATVARMSGYVPGEQPKPGERVVKLNTNENPYPPSPKVLDAIRRLEADALRRYPSPMADDFRCVAARVHGLVPDQILAGNGSDDILQIALRSYCGAGDVLVSPDPTYSLYPVLAELADVRFVTVPWGDGWRLPTDALLAADPRAIFFANPNAPSGTLASPAEVSMLASRTDALVLVDEAYVDFADAHCLDLVAQHENVLVTRTLSKGYSLAGLRFGYAVGHPAIIREMAKVKDSYNCDAIAIAAACAALEDRTYAQQCWAKVRAERARMTTELGRRGFEVIPSQANFVLTTVPATTDARDLYQALKARGILIRFFDTPGLRDKLRITIGSPEDNDALLAALKTLL